VLATASRAPNGIRTRAAALKGRCPRPLDDGGSTVTAAVALGARRRGPPQHRGQKPLPAKRTEMRLIFPDHLRSQGLSDTLCN
jgi:hypothetical protein